VKFTDHYRVLGVAPSATPGEIKAAYRALARKHHPDVSKAADAAQRFSAIGEANSVLSDVSKRAAFDALRAGGWRDGQEMEARPTARGYRPNRGPARDDEADARGFFESLFEHQPPDGWDPSDFAGRFAGGNHQRRGADLHHVLQVSVEESFNGGKRTFILDAPIRDPGGRLVDGRRTISVTIPTGVRDGATIRLRGQGRPGTDPDTAGDLYLRIELSPHHLYHISGLDVSLEVPITPWEAALGGQVPVPTLGGTVDATIPAGALPGQRLRLKGRGLPGDVPGDQYLILRPAMPTTISSKAQELYRELARESAFNPRAGLGV
jgi:curved DNA-binding protein